MTNETDQTASGNGTPAADRSRIVTNNIRRRSNERRLLTMLVTEMKKAYDTADSDAAEEHLEKLRRRETNLEAMNREIAHDVADDKLDEEMGSIAHYDDLIAEWTAKMRRVIAKQSLASMANSAQTAIGQNGSQGGTNVPQQNRYAGSTTGLTLKLPKFDMPKFSGDIVKWPTFWSAFDAAVNQRQDLCNVDKLNYLRSVLTNDAFHCIEGLTIQDENYESALDRLRERFGREDLIIDRTMTSFERLTLPKNDGVSLRKFLDEVELKVLNLKTMKVDVKACGGILRPMLVKNLPEELQIEWARNSKRSKNNSIDALIEFLKEEVELRESVRKPKETKEQLDKPKSDTGTKPKSSTAALSVTNNSDNKQNSQNRNQNRNNTDRPKKCLICGEAHFSTDCVVNSVEKRKELLKNANRCYNCLWKGHMSPRCDKDPAKCRGCRGGHHTALCPEIDKKFESSSSKEKKEVLEVAANHVSDNARQKGIVLQTAIVLVDGEKSQVKARILIDGGSQLSFVSKRLSKTVGAKQVGQKELNINGFMQNTENRKYYPKRKLRLFDRHGERCVDIEPYEVENTCSSYSLVPGQWVEEEMERRGLSLAETSDSLAALTDGSDSIELIIGSDSIWSILTGRIERLNEKLGAVETVFGWVLQGSNQENENADVLNVSAMHINVNESYEPEINENELLRAEVENFWRLENLGIESASVNEKKIDVTEVETKFKETIIHTGERYRVNLPWKDNKEELNPNYNEALRRFHVTVRKLNKDEEKMKRYHEVMMDYLKCDHAEQVNSNEKVNECNYYIPHQAVIRESHDTTKLRVVFDASSGRPSLNECLHAGPHLNPDVLELLLRFRQHKIALTADMEKAFLQVEIDENDRDCARFLWLPRDWKEGDPLTPVTYRMKRVLFGLNCGPFLLAATLKHHLEKMMESEPAVTKSLMNNIYVDDLIKSVAAVLDGWRLYDVGTELMKEAGFNLRKWTTNSAELRNLIIESEKKKGHDDLAVKTEAVKVLGMLWNQDSDELLFDTGDLTAFLTNRNATKRTVLRGMARIFDPLGLVSPFTIRLKCLFQQLWKEKMDWDDCIENENLKEWNQWINELSEMNTVVIPRCISSINGEIINTELHVFSDASEKLYGAVAYLIERTNKESRSNLIASKNKIAPTKLETIPRLELLGALIAVRLAAKVRSSLGINFETRFWTDSMVALQWIKGETSRWKQYVANRVKEIKEKSDMSAWKYVSTNENPADMVTRGQKISTLAKSDMWWKGPKWLVSPKLDETIHDEPEIDEDAVIKEERKPQSTTNTIVVKPELLWDTNRFSKWTKLIRVVAWILRFVRNCKEAEKRKGLFSRQEIEESERVVLKCEQRAAFFDDYEALTNKEELTKTSRIRKFDPQLGSDELIRLGGRLQFSMLDHSVKHPIILDGDNWTTKLLIQHSHEKVMHGGVSETMNEIRDRFWIICARTKINKVLRQCVVCMKRRARRAETIEGLLPTERLEASFPFEVIGLDYAGPIFVKYGKTEQKKTYVLLITCTVTRAVHLELVASMSVDDFLLAFRRFVARRGQCRIIWSDNAKTFKRAEKDVTIWYELTASTKVKEYIEEQKIDWKFIVERAPWWGGIWERLVKSTKDKLKVICGRAMLSFDELRTLLVEVESIINSRPLSSVPDDTKEVITPSHFLIGRRGTSLPPATNKANKLGGDAEVGKRWKARLVLLNRFWKAWRQDYLLNLRTVHERRIPKKNFEMKEGQAVLLDDERTARHLWKVCVVDKVMEGRDGLVRSCVVKTADGKFIRRPIQLLYPLEIGLNEN